MISESSETSNILPNVTYTIIDSENYVGNIIVWYDYITKKITRIYVVYGHDVDSSDIEGDIEKTTVLLSSIITSASLELSLTDMTKIFSTDFNNDLISSIDTEINGFHFNYRVEIRNEHVLNIFSMESMNNWLRQSGSSSPEIISTPSPTPDPPAKPDIVTFEPILITGNGDTTTEAIEIPIEYAVASFKHDGRRNFIVTQYDDGYNRVGGLVNKIGVYSGDKFLDVSSANGIAVFEIRADGNWTIEIKALESTEEVTFSGSGDAVSGVFISPPNGPWTFTHDGERNFIVRIHATPRGRGVVNVIGKYEGSSIVDFGNEIAFWTVQADGNWSITPQN
jgi:hypothetical protein